MKHPQMERYISTKIVFACPVPMTRDEAEKHLGRIIRTGKPTEHDDDEGRLVEYEDGYQSWSPLDAFEGAYRRADGMTWSLAFEAAKKGKKVAYSDWNGKGVWVAYNAGKEGLPAASFWNEHARKHAEDNGGTADVAPYLLMKMSNGKVMIGWSPSQVEMSSDKWYIVE